MTQKEIFKMASNCEISWRMREIESIQQNMIYKTVYEKKSATRKMKNYAREIIEILKNDVETEG